MATTVVLLLVAFLLPTAVGYGFVVLRRMVRGVSAARAHATESPTLSRLHADLCRLHDLLDDTEIAQSDLPGKSHRCKAIRAAYVDVLTEACGRLQVLPPQGCPTLRSDIYRVEADLRRRGLDVRPS